MGFLSGSASFARYRITNDPTGVFGEEHLKLLSEHKIKSSGRNLYEQPSVGFLGGAHILDTKFDFEKNILEEAMHFAIRIDSCQIPGPIKRAWTHIELSGALKDNPSGRPSKVQREEARDAVEARCAEESKKGNYQKMTVIPILWDSATETLFVGNTSEKTIDFCLSFMHDVFELEFSKISSGKLALEFANSAETTAAVYDASPAPFHPGTEGKVIWWNGMKDNYDFLGNEFLLWLWWNWQINDGTILLNDESEVAGLFARSLSLDCPLGENGKETISSDSPVTLPEAVLAIRNGKLPRKAGLTLVRNGEQYDLALQAETFSIGSARIKQLGNDVAAADHFDRIESLRQLVATLDLTFDVFCTARFSGEWAKELQKIQSWLTSDQAVKKTNKQKAA